MFSYPFYLNFTVNKSHTQDFVLTPRSMQYLPSGSGMYPGIWLSRISPRYSRTIFPVVRSALTRTNDHPPNTAPYACLFYTSGVDGQVLVLHAMLGINQEFSPRFLRRYHNLYAEMTGAVGNYINDVKSGNFPNEREQY